MNVLDIGQRIKQQRERHRLTQQQLANSLHISYQAVSKWERGENAPDISLLPLLSALFNVSIDWLLTGQDAPLSTFEASILCTSIRHFAKKSETLSPNEIAAYLNAQFSLITQCVLQFDGVPVKYTGDGFLAYFSKSDHAKRALNACEKMLALTDHPHLLISLHCGHIFLGAIGHPDYAQLDIIGPSVNTCFLINHWANTQPDMLRCVMSDAFKQTAQVTTCIPLSPVDLHHTGETVCLHSLSII